MPAFSLISLQISTTVGLGEPALIPLPTYQELSQTSVGSYEYNLIQQFNLTSDDARNFKHPLIEETTNEDLLRRVI